MKCSICGKEIVGYGNSIYPLEGRKCCDECNMKVVMPVRIFIRSLPKRNNAMLIKENEVVLVKPDDKYFMLINKLFEGDIYTLRAETFAK